jgi:hypothetical protein
MSDQLSLTCATPNKRPIVITDTMARVAAEIIADRLGSDYGDREGIIDDILHVTRYNRSMDGFQIARELSNQHFWECLMETAETLDDFSRMCEVELHKAEKQWSAENPMEPPFPIGALVKTRHGVGAIERIYECAIASYIVPIDGRNLIIRFEDCEAA